MLSRLAPCLVLPLLALLVAPLAAQSGAVITVDAAGGADFVAVQPAVDAAGEGDTLLVAQGVYGPVTIAGKGLALAGRPGASVTFVGGIEVRDTSAAQTVLLVNVRALGSHDVGRPEGLLATNLAGSLRVDGGALRGAAGIFYSGSAEFGGDAARLLGVTDAAFRGTALLGGHGEMSFTGFSANRGGDALRVTDSTVSLHGASLTAGDGGPGEFLGCDLGGEAGHGARLLGASRLHAAASSFSGGDGGGDDFLACFPGGDGLRLEGPAARATLIGSSAGGGLGACGQPNGAPVAALGGALVAALPGTARTLGSPTPVAEGDGVPFVLHGEPGDAAFLLLSPAPAQLFLPKFSGTLLLAPPFTGNPIALGTLDAGGALIAPLTAPDLPPGLDAAWAQIQAVMSDTGGTPWLGSATALVLLDAGV